jgi:hypothetical protein
MMSLNRPVCIKQFLECRNHFRAITMTSGIRVMLTPSPRLGLLTVRMGFPSESITVSWLPALFSAFLTFWGPLAAAVSCLMTSDAAKDLPLLFAFARPLPCPTTPIPALGTAIWLLVSEVAASTPCPRCSSDLEL